MALDDTDFGKGASDDTDDSDGHFSNLDDVGSLEHLSDYQDITIVDLSNERPNEGELPKIGIVQDHNISTFTPRAYQLEMLENSLQRNIILAVCFLLLNDASTADNVTDGYWIW